MVVGQFAPDNLINGDFPIVPRAVMIPAGTPAFKRGTILTTALVPVKAATVANVDRIALADCDASGADPVRCVTAITGGFNTNSLSTGDATDPATLENALRPKCIFIRSGLEKGN